MRPDPTRTDAMRDDPKRSVFQFTKGNMMGQFTRSYDVQQLVDRLAKLAIGDKLPLAELATLIGEKDVDGGKFRGKLASARRAIQKDKQIVTGVDDRILTRLDDTAIVATGQTSIQRIRRESLRGAKRLACVDYGKLSQAEQRKHDAAATHLGVLAEFSRPSTVAKIANKVDTAQKKLGLDETLAAFREGT